MDFPTLPDQPAWAQRALQHLLQLTPGQVIASTPSRGNRRTSLRTTRIDPVGQYPLGMHQHAYPELCIAIEGESRMDISNQRHAFDPPALALLPPGMPHSEAWARRQQPYCVLWLCSTGPMVRSIVSQYTPERSWEAYPWIACPWTPGRQLFEMISLPPDQLLQSAVFEQLRAALLALLAHMHHLHVTSCTTPTDTTADNELEPRQLAQLQRIRRFIDSHFDQPIHIDQLSRMCALSPNYLNRLFTRWVGCPVHAYLTRRRLEEAHRLLRETDLLAKQVAQRVGYDDPLYFSRAFKRFFGYRPGQARLAGKQEFS